MPVKDLTLMSRRAFLTGTAGVTAQILCPSLPVWSAAISDIESAAATVSSAASVTPELLKTMRSQMSLYGSHYFMLKSHTRGTQQVMPLEDNYNYLYYLIFSSAILMRGMELQHLPDYSSMSDEFLAEHSLETFPVDNFVSEVGKRYIFRSKSEVAAHMETLLQEQHRHLSRLSEGKNAKDFSLSDVASYITYSGFNFFFRQKDENGKIPVRNFTVDDLKLLAELKFLNNHGFRANYFELSEEYSDFLNLIEAHPLNAVHAHISRKKEHYAAQVREHFSKKIPPDNEEVMETLSEYLDQNAPSGSDTGGGIEVDLDFIKDTLYSGAREIIQKVERKLRPLRFHQAVILQSMRDEQPPQYRNGYYGVLSIVYPYENDEFKNKFRTRLKDYFGSAIIFTQNAGLAKDSFVLSLRACNQDLRIVDRWLFNSRTMARDLAF